MRDALLLFAKEKSESEGESQSREESINRNTTEDRYRNRVIRPSLSFFKKAEEKKAKKKTKRNLQSTAKDDDDDVKNDAKTYLGRKASER